MQYCLEISMGSWPALLHTKFIQSLYHSHTSYFVLATKQTLLSILLANHALLETYFQDEDSQMDTIEARGPLVNSQPEV